MQSLCEPRGKRKCLDYWPYTRRVKIQKMKRQIKAASGPAKRNKLSKCTLKLPLTVIEYSLQWLIPTDSEYNCIQLQAFVTAVSFEPLATWHKSLQLGHLKSVMLENRLGQVWALCETAEKYTKKYAEDAEEATEKAKEYQIMCDWQKYWAERCAQEAK